jgi:hypothetical protein
MLGTTRLRPTNIFFSRSSISSLGLSDHWIGKLGFPFNKEESRGLKSFNFEPNKQMVAAGISWEAQPFGPTHFKF